MPSRDFSRAFKTTMAATIRVKLFARYAEFVGTDEATVTVASPAKVGDVVARVRALPGGKDIPERPLVAVNLRQARWDAPVSAGDEIALLPPMSGG